MQRDRSCPELLPGRSFDLIVVGSGLAGLSAALLASAYGDVLLLTKARLADSNTAFAQGGIAASLAPGDSPEIHYQDTMVAVDGLGDPRAIRALVEEGPGCVEELIALGVPFDRTDGEIAFTREGAHSQARVLHAGGDATGASIEATMVERVRAARRVTIREDALVTDLLVDGERVVGVRLLDDERSELREAHGRAVLLATGGAGQLFAHTTNPVVATGDGIAAAWRAGAMLADLEFYQFHPTALALPGAPRFLISEAVRGEGGILRNRAGERFMLRYDSRAELAPRDIVARSIVFEMQRTGDPSAYLDVRQLGASHVRARFPTISRVCGEFGIDIGHDLIPVAPAAHYLMGGIRTDLWGQTTLPGLYASGECACSGVHGANRLASNSLLETLVFSVRAVQQHFGRRHPEAADPWQPAVGDELLPPKTLVIAADPVPPPTILLSRETLQARVWESDGLIRNAAGLGDLSTTAAGWLANRQSQPSRVSVELSNLTTLARLAAEAGMCRTESRGAHYRTDFPNHDLTWRRHLDLINAQPAPLAFPQDRLEPDLGQPVGRQVWQQTRGRE